MAEITIREVLIWEFGESVLENPDFSRVVKQVTEVLMQQPPIAKALTRLINEMGLSRTD
ncbi:hypothetical protein [Fluviicoccus keumensis]|nr:hypothetical protein [Fluviicoccus keumensis]